MTRRTALALGAAVALALALAVAGGFHLWHKHMQLRWETKARMSEAAAENRMLGALMLLRQAGHSVEVAASLGALNLRNLPDGTLIIGDQIGVTPPDTAQLLLAWVGRGNTLVTQPRWANPAERARQPAVPAQEVDKGAEDEAEPDQQPADPDDDDDAPAEAAPAKSAKQNRAPAPEALVETDPIADGLGVLRYSANAKRVCTQEHERVTAGTTHKHRHCIASSQYRAQLHRLDLAGLPYPLALDIGNGKLVARANAPAPLWADQKGEVIRVYRQGKGKIVMMAGNYFTNADLHQYDHGELLLQLAALAGPGSPVTIVKTLAVLPWYTALWRHYSYPLSAAAVFLALLLWVALRRFGPVLPQAALERRSLMEHIAASGAWLWHTGDGHQVLLEAARQETLARVRRRAPALFRLPPHELPAALARDAGLDPALLAVALHGEAARQAPRFTRQIRLLQELRNHYER